jgi:hypothetical protein
MEMLFKRKLMPIFLLKSDLKSVPEQSKKFPGETWPKIYLGQDPDLDVFKSRIRIRSKIVRIHNPDIITLQVRELVRWKYSQIRCPAFQTTLR